MNDLETLRPEVRETVDAFDIGARIGMTFGNKGWNIIRAELLRLAKENADLLSTIDLDEQVWVQRDETMHRWIERARNAEAELAALKERIAEAPIVEIANIGDPFIVLPDHLTVPNSMKGQRVRLVVEE